MTNKENENIWKTFKELLVLKMKRTWNRSLVFICAFRVIILLVGSDETYQSTFIISLWFRFRIVLNRT